MLAVSYTTIRNNLKEYCDKVTDEHETVIVTREEEKNIVIMSLEDYNDMVKAVKNAEYIDRLNISMEQKLQGKTVTKTMEDLEAPLNE